MAATERKARLTSRSIITYYFVQEEKCSSALLKVKNNIDDLFTQYFYILGLNKAFCSGIGVFLGKPERISAYHPEVVQWFRNWRDKDCSFEAYTFLQRSIENWTAEG